MSNSQLEKYDKIGMTCIGIGIAGLIMCFFLAMFVSVLDECQQITHQMIQNICLHKTEFIEYLVVGGGVIFGLCSVMALSSYHIWKKNNLDINNEATE